MNRRVQSRFEELALSGNDHADDEEDRSHDEAEDKPASPGTRHLCDASPHDETKDQPTDLDELAEAVDAVGNPISVNVPSPHCLRPAMVSRARLRSLRDCHDLSVYKKPVPDSAA